MHEAWQKEIEDLKKKKGTHSRFLKSPKNQKTKRKQGKVITIEVVPNTEAQEVRHDTPARP